MTKITQLTFAFAALFFASTAYSAIFVKIPSIPGDAVTRGYEGSIAFSDMAWSATDVAAKNSSCTEITALTGSKMNSADSAFLHQALANGTTFPEVTVHFVRNGGSISDQVEYLTLILRQMQVSAMSMTVNDTVQESVSLNFEEMEGLQAAFDQTGRRLEDIPFLFDNLCK